METFGKITLHEGDCMDVMKSLPDNAFDLAICDPPYGIDFGNYNRTNKMSDGTRVKANKFHHTDWDKLPPPAEYFKELQRVSKNQIIWGGNYFPLPPTKCFIFWYKHQPVNNFADGEFAWTSFNRVAKCFDYPYFGNINAEPKRIHPTQKPIALYGWLMKNFANPGDKILDTHLGSASICIAAHDLGFEMLGIELDPIYYKAARQRLLYHQAQLSIF
jgi:site-specific DNA-methyltransferase (adenine-specific)